MKKNVSFLLAFLLAAAPLSACAGSSDNGAAGSDEFVTIQVNTEGLGYIAVSEDGSEPVIEDDDAYTSHITNVEKGSELTLTCKAGEDHKFVRWTKDGTEYSAEQTVKITADADAEYVAVFLLDSGYEGEAVSDIRDVKTIGDVLALPTLGSGFGTTRYVYAFDLGGTIYQAVAEIDAATSDAMFALEFDDPDYDKKLNEMVAPLAVKEVINLTEQMPSDADLEKYTGMTFQELFDEGWYNSGWNFEDNVAYMSCRWYEFEAGIDPVADPGSFDEEALAQMTVKSMKCTGIGDAGWFED